MKIIKYLGWEKCDYNDYKKASYLYGYNNETSPHYIDFAIKNGAKLDFYALTRKGEIVGSCCVDNGWLCNDTKNAKSQTQDIPVPKNSILLPFQKGINCIIPFKTKYLSRQKDFKVINSSYELLSKRNVAIAKSTSEISKKTISTRNRETKKFIAEGGSFTSVRDFSASEINDMYSHLYACRRPGEIALSSVGLVFIENFKDNIFGDIAFLKDQPVGMQLNLTSESRQGIFIDFINIGYDVTIKKHSLGTLMMWRNLQLAEQYAESKDLPLTYSFGMMSGEYKSRWCNPVRIGRLIR